MPPADRICEQNEQDPGRVTHTRLEAGSNDFLAVCPALHILQLNVEGLSAANFFYSTHIRTHAFNGPLSGNTLVSWYQKGKPVWILLKQETVSGSGIHCAICKCAPRSRQITTPAPHYSLFLQAGCPSCRPTNSVKALKAEFFYSTREIIIMTPLS